jgi:DNA-binding response OmpR family regulator
VRVLLVEDEAAMADALRAGLTREGFAVDVADNGTDGLFQATEVDYDVVVLDLMLPELSGYEVLRRLRAAQRWTPVLVLTAKDGEHDIGDALDLGADDYLVKPFSYVVLLARIRALVRRGGRARPALLEVGDLAVDPATHRCRRGDVDIALTAREFAVLEYLMRNAERVVPKRELVEHVWDEHFDGDPNIVEVYVGYLRRKIDTPFGRWTINTVRGAGYQLTDSG